MTESATPPPGFPAGIPVSQTTFENWDLAINVASMWTCQPRNEDDVVAVCNWAAGAGWQVRASGIRHTWSPITIAATATPGGNILVVDTTASLTAISFLPPAGPLPGCRYVKVQTGVTMDALMSFLEAQDGIGDAPGYSFAHIPAPGHLTIGGVLAINAHGTAIRTPPVDDLPVPYGSMSNQIVAFTAVVTDPNGSPTTYVAKTFQRGDTDAKAFLSHLGRAFLLDVTLQATPNYNLRCESHMDITANTLFAAPTTSQPVPPQSVADFLGQSGRVEVIWFPIFPIFGFTPDSYPWLKVWTHTPQKPASSREVTSPYNYPFSDNLPTFVTDLLKQVLGGHPELTPAFTLAFAAFTKAALYGDVGFENATDLWGASKNTMIYIKDSTLRVTANGYAVQMKKADVQQSIADFTTEFSRLLAQFQNQGLYPINSPLEIRVTNLDDPSLIFPPDGGTAESPVISSLSRDSVAIGNGWDVAVWFDVLTVQPAGDPLKANDFYAQLESWFQAHFASGFRVMPEWSKGWAYTSSSGAWTSPAFMQFIRQNFTTGRTPDNDWAWETATLAKYDASSLFHAPLLDQLFVS